jgi:RNA-directed DNA polymerase
MAEMPESGAGRQGRNPEDTADGASNVATTEENPSRPIAVTMEEVVNAENMREAYRRVVSNHGAPGIDGMSVDGLGDHLRKHWPRIKEELLGDRYRPASIRAVEIPKPNGGYEATRNPDSARPNDPAGSAPETRRDLRA